MCIYNEAFIWYNKYVLSLSLSSRLEKKMNTFSRRNFSVTPEEIAEKIHSTQYLGKNGAIALANRLTSAAYPWEEEDAHLLIMGARMNAYYSAAGYYQGKGITRYPRALCYLYAAKILADEFLSHFIGRKALKGFEHAGIIQQCQAVYAKWAVVKQRMKLSVAGEEKKVFFLHANIHANMYATWQLKTLADAVVYEFPGIKETEKGGGLRQLIVIATDCLQKDVNRSQDDSQVLSRLLRSVGRHHEAEEVAVKAGLEDQASKARVSK